MPPDPPKYGLVGEVFWVVLTYSPQLPQEEPMRLRKRQASSSSSVVEPLSCHSSNAVEAAVEKLALSWDLRILVRV